jgi:hypothetical protein
MKLLAQSGKTHETSSGQTTASNSLAHCPSTTYIPRALQVTDPRTKLYKFVQGTRGTGSWELISENTSVSFYNANEDSETNNAPEWHLEFDGAQEAPDVIIHDRFTFEQKENRCSFPADESFWALKFGSQIAFGSFCQRFNKALFENTYQVDQMDAAKIFGKDTFFNFGGETRDSQAAWAEDMDIDDDPRQEDWKSTPLKESVAAIREGKIQGIVMGGGERSFLLREGGTLDVMKNVLGGVVDAKISFQITPEAKVGQKGKSRLGMPPGNGGALGTPPNAMLMNQETRMNVCTPGSGTISHMDIETQKIVNEFEFNRNGVTMQIQDMVGNTKRAQLENQSTFLSLAKNSLARVDTRVSSGLVQQAASPVHLGYVGGKDYARGTNFTCFATSGDGYVVVGSDDGKIRLYNDKTLTQAKTSIPSLGHSITSIDVSYDGKWVLATTDRYLIVVKTTYKDPTSGQELCGFTSRMGSKAPAPRLLRLKVEDVGRTGGTPFRKGHFTWITEKGRQERWIVASCGNFTVLWNFRSVKLANPDVTSMAGLTTVTSYHLIPKLQHVVDARFMHDRYLKNAAGYGQSNMVIVTDNEVINAHDDDEDDDDDDDDGEATPTLSRRLRY